MTTHIICPSGLAGEIRGLKGKEGKLLSDRTAARAGALFEKILAGCWLTTSDPGIYDLPEGGTVDWSRVLVADRFFTLLQIRAQTFGNDYAFSVQCQGPACRERFEWSLDLQELPVVPLSDAAKAAFLAERPNHKKDFNRLKGLGEMDHDELKVTTMDVERRPCSA